MKTTFISRELDAKLQNLASNFCCGNNKIDGFIRSNRALDIGFGKTFVWLSDDESEIIGFYNITTGNVDIIPDVGKPYKAGGTIHINEFAISEDYQGNENNGIRCSDILLNDCITRIEHIRTKVGFAFITLQSTERGYSLYLRNDFEDIEEDMKVTKSKEEIECKPMYLALDIEP